jgi:hypothetical protein
MAMTVTIIPFEPQYRMDIPATSRSKVVRWKPTLGAQLAKLANKDSKWHLIGCSSIETAVSATRTRNGGHGWPNLSKKMVLESDSDEDSEYEDATEDEVDSELDELYDDLEDELGLEEPEELEALDKPSHNRVILEVKTLMEALKIHCRCPECGESVEPELKTVCWLYGT